MLSVVLIVITAIIAYSVGGVATLWNVRKQHPDLYEELNRRVNGESL